MSSSRSETEAPPAPPPAPKKLLVANRCEIAIRIFRAATELGLRTVAIYAQEDRFPSTASRPTRPTSVGEGKGPVGAYLDIEGIVALAKDKGVDAIHPGYGFLSENAEFARACARGGHHLRRPAARVAGHDGRQDRRARPGATPERARRCPGPKSRSTDREEALEDRAGASAFRSSSRRRSAAAAAACAWCNKAADLARLLDEAQAEAGRAFGNPAVFLEKYIPRAKHIEVQVLGDQHGNVIHLHERDCSVQRRHQKVVEIAPSYRRCRSRSCANCATPPSAWPARSATTTPAPSSSSTTWTATSGSSSR